MRFYNFHLLCIFGVFYFIIKQRGNVLIEHDTPAPFEPDRIPALQYRRNVPIFFGCKRLYFIVTSNAEP